MNSSQAPNGASSLSPAQVAQVAEIQSELDDLKSQRLVIEADLLELKKLRDSSMPSRGGPGLDPEKDAELHAHLAEDIAAIGKINARAAELNAELNRLVPQPRAMRDEGPQNRNLPIEVRFMREARAILSPDVYAAILNAAQGQGQGQGQGQPQAGGGHAPSRNNRDNRGRRPPGGNGGQQNRHHRGDRGRR